MGLRLFGFILLSNVLVSFMRAEASVCETPSNLFRGLCFRDANCGSICETEGYLTGRCKGFRLRCICAKDCATTTTTTTPSHGGSSSDNPPAGGDDGSSGGDGPPEDGPATFNMA